MSFKCQQCGRCCLEVGRTFWKNGDFTGYPGLQERASDGYYEDGGLACEMLASAGGEYICLLEKVYGRDVKPRVCREYPEALGEPCFREQKGK